MQREQKRGEFVMESREERSNYAQLLWLLTSISHAMLSILRCVFPTQAHNETHSAKGDGGGAVLVSLWEVRTEYFIGCVH
jgi:hypothetical protein